MKNGNSERILVDHLRMFQQEQLKEVDDFLAIFGSTYKLFEKENAQIPRKIQFAYSNIKFLQRFLQGFSVEHTREGTEITGFTLSWGTDRTYGFDSSKANIKQLVQVLNIIGKALADIAQSQINILEEEGTPPIQVITKVVEAYERVINMYVMRNDE